MECSNVPRSSDGRSGLYAAVSNSDYCQVSKIPREINGISVSVYRYIFKRTSIWSPGGSCATHKRNQLNGVTQYKTACVGLHSINAVVFSSMHLRE